MAQTVKISGSNAYEIEQKSKVLQGIANNLNLDEIQKLGKIASSAKGKSYLSGSKYMVLKGFLKL